MATTKIKGISTSSHLQNAIDYIKADKKTKDGELVSCLNCKPELAYLEFQMVNKKYGKNQEKNRERDKWMAYHVH